MRRLLSTVWAAALLVLSATPLLAQAETLREQGLGRAYWHVFIAYAIAVLLILGWVISIARRLRRVEDRLRSSGD
jgi:uncharacterized membrane protein YcjF (UPF0283 family)